MKYQIVGDTLPAVICQLEPGEKMITEGGGMSWMSPTLLEWRYWEYDRKNVFRREGISECLYCTGRRRNDRICILLPGIDSCI